MEKLKIGEVYKSPLTGICFKILSLEYDEYGGLYVSFRYFNNPYYDCKKKHCSWNNFWIDILCSDDGDMQGFVLKNSKEYKEAIKLKLNK